MKSKFALRTLAYASTLLTVSFSSAASLYWDGANASWNNVSNWSTVSGADTPDPASIPGALDDVIFNITTVNGNESVTLNADQSAQSLTFNNTGTTSLLGGGLASTLTVGTGGITIASGAGAVTLGDNTAANDVLISLSRGSQTWSNQSSNVFTINNSASSFSRVGGAILTFNPATAGFSMNTTVLPNDASGIVGPWAFHGTGASTRYAYNNAGTIDAYLGGTGVADANLFADADTNYDFSTTGTTTLTAVRTANTIYYTGTGNVIDLGASGANNLNLNGILAVGASGTLTIQRTGGTGTVAIGATNELVIAGTQAVTINAPISGSSKALTYSGSNTLTLGGANSWTGSLNVNSGTVSSSTASILANAVNVRAGATYNLVNAFGVNPTYTGAWVVDGTYSKNGNGSIAFGAAATISGSGTMSFAGQTTLTLSGNNSGFTGTMTDSILSGGGSGTIFGNAGAFGSGTFVFNTANTIASSVANLTNANVTAFRLDNGAFNFGGSNNMNLGAGTFTLNANAAFNVSNTLTIGGTIAETGGARTLTKSGAGTLVLEGALSHTGSTTVSAGNLNLTGTSAYNGSVIVSGGLLDLGGGTATGSLGATPTLTLGGGRFSYTRTGTNTQSFATTNLNSAPANVLTVAAGNTLNLGNIVRAAGVYYDFSTVLGGGIVAANISNNSAAGIMSTAFTVGDSWAVANDPGLAISALSTYTLTSVAGTSAANYLANNMDVDSSEGVLDGDSAPNSVRFSEAAANTMTLTGANVITSGGILVGSAVGNNLSTITGGTITGSNNGELSIWQNNGANDLLIESNIINSGTTALSKYGAGKLILSGTNTYTGTTIIYGGTLVVSNGASIAGLVTLANVAGATLQIDSSETINNLSGGGTSGGTVALQGNTLTIGDGTAQTFAGSFSGTGSSSIIKQGAGVLTLSNATSIPGTMTINAGTVLVSQGRLSGGTITLNANNATLSISGNSSPAGASGLGGLIISNPIALSSSVTTTGANLYASTGQGKWIFTGGITGGATSGSQTLKFDTRAGGINGGDRTTTEVAGVISNGTGGGVLNLSFNITPQTSSNSSNPHPANFNLTAVNTFTGTITAIRGNAGATSWLTIGGERWTDGSFGGNNPIYGREGSGYLAGPSNDGNFSSAINFGATANQIVNLNYFSSANQTLSGVIGGSGANGALVKEGTGTLTLTNANLYNSLTSIGGGILALGFDTTTNNILPATTPLSMGLGTIYDPITANADIIISGGGGGGTLQLAGPAASATQTVASLTVAPNTANRIIMGADRTLTVTSPTIAIGANSGLNFNTLAGANNGATVGTSIVAFGGVPTAFTNGFTVTDAGGFGLAAVNGSNQVIRDTSTSLLPASGALAATNYRVDNNAGGPAADGSSTLTVTANQSASSITVDTTAASGVLTLDSGIILSNNVWNFGATSGTNTYEITGGAGVRAVATGNTVSINNFNAGAVTFTSPILQNGATANPLVVGGTGTVSLAGLNTYTGATAINSGSLRIIGSGRLVAGTYAGAVTINGGSVFQYSSDQLQTLTGAISGAGGITKDGSGTLILQNNAASVYTGPTLITTGRLTNDRAASGVQGGLSAGSAVTVSSGAQLNISGNVTTVANNITITGVGISENNGATTANSGAIRVQNSNALTGRITLAGNSRIGFNTAGSGPTATYAGKITGAYALEFFGMYGTNNGANAIHVLGNTNTINANDYTGDTSISAEATGITGIKTTLRLAASEQIPHGTGKGNLVFNGADADHLTVLELNGSNETINGLSNAAADGAVIQNTATGASTLTIGDANTTSSFSGTITDGGVGKTLALTKIGTGTLALSGNNTYTGATSVSQGTLALQGGSLASAVTVSPSASLSFALGSTVSSTSTVNLSTGTVKITGTPTLPSYTLITTTGISGTPVLDIPVPGYALQVVGNDLQLNATGGDMTPPTLVSITDNVSGGPINIGATVNYTVTFSEDINDVTVTAADFDNDGTALISVGAISESSPGVFTVAVTVNSPGSLKLRIPIGSVIQDLATNPLAVPVSDDTTITVRNAYQTWALTNAISSAPGQDKDGDGVNNAIEFVLGGTVGGNDLGKLPTVSTTATDLIFSFQRARSSRDGVTSLKIEVGTTLTGWSPIYTVGNDTAGSTPGVVVTENSPSGFDTITLTVPKGTDPKKFARLNATVTE